MLRTALILCLAEGFGVGRLGVAPGTFGSLLGVLWLALLLSTGSLLAYVAGMTAAVALAVWVCGEAERILRQRDPPSVVLDEIAALPLCFLGWVLLWRQATGAVPAPLTLLVGDGWCVTLGLFAAFRFFDIAKPWPVEGSQRLPGGWGVTADDVLAALYVNVVWLAPALVLSFLRHP